MNPTMTSYREQVARVCDADLRHRPTAYSASVVCVHAGAATFAVYEAAAVVKVRKAVVGGRYPGEVGVSSGL